jgi:DNA-binding MarR family transcriptional regulator
VDEIAAAVVRQKNSVTTLVDRMSKLGLVKKEKLKNGNKYRISLTEKARELISVVPRKSIEMMFSEFTQEDKEQLLQYLEQIIKTGKDLLGEYYVPPFLTPKSVADSAGHGSIENPEPDR